MLEPLRSFSNDRSGSSGLSVRERGAKAPLYPNRRTAPILKTPVPIAGPMHRTASALATLRET